MKTILVPTSGSDSDRVVFETALTAARLLLGHLEFLHLRIDPGEAALYTPHAEFARGAAIASVMTQLREESVAHSVGALQHFRGFCERMKIEITETPRASRDVTASWREEGANAVAQLIRRARLNDLVAMARPAHADGLPRDLLERVLVACGRPVLIVPRQPAPTLDGTAMVAWKETAEAARALSAALPLLSKAARVVVVAVAENGEAQRAVAEDLARQLAWHGIRAEGRHGAADGRTVADVLTATASALGAGLLVMGGYGRSRARELIFGGCTRAMLDGAELPVLMLH